ncbi:brain-specific angiogenesis inhibitor1-associated protein 2 [Striga asiatica]|uniref:Brain-specific angiogenesis inhibitor1-associated protein 2 n=1 Tax=Striga asiatica TaxID=4170 RepID=A0A5A7QME4_STRAF|nr:brain-specific angiogenesis inhibitor1-associated protein 2 [Striga asiatica]
MDVHKVNLCFIVYALVIMLYVAFAVTGRDNLVTKDVTHYFPAPSYTDPWNRRPTPFCNPCRQGCYHCTSVTSRDNLVTKDDTALPPPTFTDPWNQVPTPVCNPCRPYYCYNCQYGCCSLTKDADKEQNKH